MIDTPAPAWDGRPLIRPEMDGEHCLSRRGFSSVETWNAGPQTWGHDKASDMARLGFRYVAPILTPADLAAMLAAERAKEREACMMICNVKAASYCSRDSESTDMRRGALSCAAAIRAMGETA